ncbi:MAG: hypothetical protein HRT61_18380 [Ekhidna sp.]|nr:hypothetical protein [Ekhidna sp.]
MKFELPLYIFIFTILTQVWGQVAISDLDLLKETREWYNREANKSGSYPFLGKYIDVARQTSSTHQFYRSKFWTPSRITFKGHTYDSLPILYDLDTDILLINYPVSAALNAPAVLEQSQISSFELHDGTFRYHPKGILDSDPGFFEELFAGNNISLIVKRQKSLETTETVNYLQDDKYYILAFQEYKRFRNRSSFFSSFKKYKAQLKRRLKDKKIRALKPREVNDRNLIFLFSETQRLISDE